MGSPNTSVYHNYQENVVAKAKQSVVDDIKSDIKRIVQNKN